MKRVPELGKGTDVWGHTQYYFDKMRQISDHRDRGISVWGRTFFLNFLSLLYLFLFSPFRHSTGEGPMPSVARSLLKCGGGGGG